MPNCASGISADILRDCENESFSGLEVNALFFNRNEIKKSAVVFDPLKKTSITNFAMNLGKKGFLIEGIKQVNTLSFELIKKEKSTDRYRHMFSGVLPSISTENKDRLLELSRGGNLAIMVELKYKGALSKEAFQLAGYDNGLEISKASFKSTDNDGGIAIDLESVANFEETKPILTVLQTDYALTKVAFNNGFIGV